jgi:hypothetical protein
MDDYLIERILFGLLSPYPDDGNVTPLRVANTEVSLLTPLTGFHLMGGLNR